MSLESVWQDVRLAWRVLRRSPEFSATIVLTLTLGLGANAAIFGVVNSLLLRPLAVADPHRLVAVRSDAALAHGYAAGLVDIRDVAESAAARAFVRRGHRLDAGTIRPGAKW
jgi:hypothetical protein